MYIEIRTKKTNITILSTDYVKVQNDCLYIRRPGLEEGIFITDFTAVKMYQEAMKKYLPVKEPSEKIKVLKREVAILSGTNDGKKVDGIVLVRITSNKGISVGISICSLQDSDKFDRDIGVGIAMPYAYEALRLQRSIAPWKRHKTGETTKKVTVNKGTVAEHTKICTCKIEGGVKESPVAFVCGYGSILDYSRGIFEPTKYINSLFERAKKDKMYSEVEIKTKGKKITIDPTLPESVRKLCMAKEEGKKYVDVN